VQVQRSTATPQCRVRNIAAKDSRLKALPPRSFGCVTAHLSLIREKEK